MLQIDFQSPMDEELSLGSLTKRKLLKTVVSDFDPLDLAGPSILKGKSLLRKASKRARPGMRISVKS